MALLANADSLVIDKFLYKLQETLGSNWRQIVIRHLGIEESLLDDVLPTRENAQVKSAFNVLLHWRLNAVDIRHSLEQLLTLENNNDFSLEFRTALKNGLNDVMKSVIENDVKEFEHVDASDVQLQVLAHHIGPIWKQVASQCCEMTAEEIALCDESSDVTMVGIALRTWKHLQGGGATYGLLLTNLSKANEENQLDDSNFETAKTHFRKEDMKKLSEIFTALDQHEIEEIYNQTNPAELAMFKEKNETHAKQIDAQLHRCNVAKNSILKQQNQELRILVVGKSGSGLSSVANMLLNKPSFETGDKSTSSTSKLEEGLTISESLVIRVIDTPGYNHDLLSELEKALHVWPNGFHALVYVLNGAASLVNAEETNAIGAILATFGSRVIRHSILVVTHGDQCCNSITLSDLQEKFFKDDIGDVIDLLGCNIVAVDAAAKNAYELNAYRRHILRLVQDLVAASKAGGYQKDGQQNAMDRIRDRIIKHRMSKRNTAEKITEQYCCEIM